MNNKGFAITGIIYTLFILFLMILISILSGIRIMQRSASDSTFKLTQKLESLKKYEGIEASDLIDGERIGLPDDEEGYYKYVFNIKGTVKDDDDREVEFDSDCVTYISESIQVNEIVFTTPLCNKYQGIKDEIKKLGSTTNETIKLQVYKLGEW